MGRTKDLWIAECEQIFQSYVDEEITTEEAMRRLREKGYRPEDAADELAACKE